MGMDRDKANLEAEPKSESSVRKSEGETPDKTRRRLGKGLSCALADFAATVMTARKYEILSFTLTNCYGDSLVAIGECFRLDRDEKE